MPRYHVISPYDGLPVPARNTRERDALIRRGYLAAAPEVPSDEPDRTGEAAGSDSGDFPADGKRGRVRRQPTKVADEMADDTSADNEVPPAVE